mmetsp:Transcript_35906/g.101703  ORF Transcript_35906/g.101703 Transcript_35906/m.101703 type:complete len:202 (+) Transcript_35906:1101-1706(+)
MADVPAKVPKAFSRSNARRSVPLQARERMRTTGFPICFSLSAMPNRERISAPPLMLKPAPRAGRSSSNFSNTFTTSTPVSSRCSASAAAKPPGPAPITATRFGPAEHVTLTPKLEAAVVRGWGRLARIGREALAPRAYLQELLAMIHAIASIGVSAPIASFGSRCGRAAGISLQHAMATRRCCLRRLPETCRATCETACLF